MILGSKRNRPIAKYLHRNKGKMCWQDSSFHDMNIYKNVFAFNTKRCSYCTCHPTILNILKARSWDTYSLPKVILVNIFILQCVCWITETAGQAFTWSHTRTFLQPKTMAYLGPQCADVEEKLHKEMGKTKFKPQVLPFPGQTSLSELLRSVGLSL